MPRFLSPAGFLLPSELQNHAAGAALQLSQFFAISHTVCARSSGDEFPSACAAAREGMDSGKKRKMDSALLHALLLDWSEVLALLLTTSTRP
jgi:hypothetical protein|tara:strand:+ start:2069 stop:2344 length:276 start_codon:yes stop_codon:yes gene_type:complete